MRAWATALISSALHRDRSVPFGKYCRSRPLVFSLVPRCQGLWGSAKNPGRRFDREACVRRQLLAAVPRQRPAQLLGQLGDRLGEGSAHRDRPVAGEIGAVLRPRAHSPAGFTRQVDQHHEPRRPLNQCPDRGALQTDDQIPFPVPGNSTVGNFGGPFADQGVAGNMRPRALLRPCSGNAKRATGSQAGDEFALEGATALDVERLVDRLVADAHGLILRELGPEPAGDLLRAPPGRPCPIGPVGLVAALHCGPWGPVTGRPSAVRITPANRCWMYSRSRSLVSSFAIFGRRARRSACHCAVEAL